MDAQLIANTNQEEALLQIRSMRNENITAVQHSQIENTERILYISFFWLCRTKYGLSREQLLEFSDDKIEALAEGMCRYSQKRAVVEIALLWIFGLLIPIGGWAFLLTAGVLYFEGEEGIPWLKYFNYRSPCNKLRKILGDKYFSATRLRGLQQKGKLVIYD